MPKKLNTDEVVAILESGNFDALIGVIEDEHLECKAGSYRLEHNRQRQEFAKDVSALANHSGGIILIGIGTKRDPAQLGDVIRNINPFHHSLLNIRQYHDIIDSWVYPKILGIKIQYFHSSENREKGILAIIIPAQNNKPFLVTRTVDDRGKQIEIVFGYVERKRAGVDPMSVQKLHELIKDGLRFDSLSYQIENVQEIILNLRKDLALGKELSTQEKCLELLKERIEKAISEIDLINSPVLILAALPIPHIEIPALFERRESEIVNLLRHPPELRAHGFDLNTGTSPNIVRGELRRSVTRQYKILDLWRDGTLVFIGRGDCDFLSWPKPLRSGALRINQLALIETTFLFVELCRRVYNMAKPIPENMKFHLELRNMTINGNPCVLTPGPLGTMAWQFEIDTYLAPNSGKIIQFNLEGSEIKPGEVAFELLKKLYEWFGIEHENIPYTERVEDRLFIKKDKILETP
jgi:hypothetical protein